VDRLKQSLLWRSCWPPVFQRPFAHGHLGSANGAASSPAWGKRLRNYAAHNTAALKARIIFLYAAVVQE
jgi:hypothetical protein